MKNVASYDTALLLQEAGFPQPEPAFGQVWYTGDGPYECFLVNGEKERNGSVLCAFMDSTIYSGISRSRFNAPGRIFAPTAADILEQLPAFAPLYQDKDGTWSCVSHYGSHPSVYGLDTSVKAAALVWMMIQKEKELT